MSSGSSGPADKRREPSGSDIIVAEKLVKRITTSADGGGTSLAILDQLDLRIAAGSSVAIVGASGSGKTTLLSLLAGLDSPTSGEITLAGSRLSLLDEDGRAALRAGRIGFVFQSFQLLASLTALENVMLPAELAGQRDAPLRARRWLDKVGLSQRLGHYPYQLSGGEQQRVAIARAFAADPQILFADEPTGNLDAATGAAIIDLLFALNQGFGRDHGATLVLVTHDERLAARCARVLRLREGRLHEDLPSHV
jgi:putative ABC transport system ATP-binding protein